MGVFQQSPSDEPQEDDKTISHKGEQCKSSTIFGIKLSQRARTVQKW